MYLISSSVGDTAAKTMASVKEKQSRYCEQKILIFPSFEKIIKLKTHGHISCNCQTDNGQNISNPALVSSVMV